MRRVAEGRRPNPQPMARRATGGAPSAPRGPAGTPRAPACGPGSSRPPWRASPTPGASPPPHQPHEPQVVSGEGRAAEDPVLILRAPGAPPRDELPAAALVLFDARHLPLDLHQGPGRHGAHLHGGTRAGTLGAHAGLSLAVLFLFFPRRGAQARGTNGGAIAGPGTLPYGKTPFLRRGLEGAGGEVHPSGLDVLQGEARAEEVRELLGPR
eukprot:CAMPEP_0182857020 /NCGR_PEP_ID=MMETSP0034_2-20130328/2800_1 /TAXON_ID=156128 /ORGANISM="Nephroselmis pyriformis, Strain CCMP717" /LENGTH=210 /DNA_ID=CAMNT_0024988199 /DNA_START=162 /DNA_END=791 /DNA_ORIENTATION=-